MSIFKLLYLLFTNSFCNLHKATATMNGTSKTVKMFVKNFSKEKSYSGILFTQTVFLRQICAQLFDLSG